MKLYYAISVYTAKGKYLYDAKENRIVPYQITYTKRFCQTT